MEIFRQKLKEENDRKIKDIIDEYTRNNLGYDPTLYLKYYVDLYIIFI